MSESNSGRGLPQALGPGADTSLSIKFTRYWVDYRAEGLFLAGSVVGTRDVRSIGQYTDAKMAGLPANERHHISAAIYPVGLGRRDDTKILAVPFVVFDDVGTLVPSAWWKDKREDLGWLMETSLGNFQRGYCFDPPLSPGVARSLLSILKAMPVIGIGLHSLGQFFRTPSGLNSKPGRGDFATRLVRIGETCTLEEFCADFGIDVSVVKSGVVAAPAKAAGGSAVPGDMARRVAVVREILGFLPNGVLDRQFEAREDWIRVAHALAGELGEDGKETWLWWNEQRPQAPGEVERVWDTLQGSHASGVTLRRLVEERWGRDSQPYRRTDGLLAFEPVEDVSQSPLDTDVGSSVPPTPPPAPPPPVSVGGEDFNFQGRGPDQAWEIAVARWIEQTYGKILKFNSDTGKWIEFHVSGGWKTWDLARIANLSIEWAEANAGGVIQNRTAIAKIQKTAFHHGVEAAAKTYPSLRVKQGDFDRDARLMGSPTGVTNMETGAKRAARASDMVSRRTAVDPAEFESCPRWLRFMDEVTGGDAEVKLFLKQWFGYCLTGLTREQIFLFIYGPGGNGKSVLVDTVAAIMGDYFVKPVGDLLLKGGGGRHLQELAMLAGARLVTVSEVPAGSQWNETLLKDLTGGGKITANFMRQNSFSFVPEFKITAYGNHKPTFPGGIDPAIRRRFRMLEFKFVPRVVDKNLFEDLRSEWPGILRWMINGLVDPKVGYWAVGLLEPRVMQKATDAYLDDQDPMGRWIRECVARKKGDVTSSRDLFSAWEEWKQLEGAANVFATDKTFGVEMNRRGYKSRHGKKGAVYDDVTVKSVTKSGFSAVPDDER